MADQQGLSLAEWRALNAPVEDVLPSGLAVKWRRVSLENLVVEGYLPMTLLMSAAEDIGDDKVELDVPNILENVQDYIGLINAAVKGALVEPAVADEPDDTHIAVSELSFDDRIYLFTKAIEEVSAVEPFREEPGEPAES